jgi:hypothetical protein
VSNLFQFVCSAEWASLIVSNILLSRGAREAYQVASRLDAGANAGADVCVESDGPAAGDTLELDMDMDMDGLDMGLDEDIDLGEDMSLGGGMGGGMGLGGGMAYGTGEVCGDVPPHLSFAAVVTPPQVGRTSVSFASLPVSVPCNVFDADWNKEPLEREPPKRFQMQYRAPAVQPPAPIQSIDWGQEHPDYNNKSGVRIKWSSAEVEYIRQWLEENGNSVNTLAKCLDHMQSDRDAIRIFHQHHTLHTGRLQHIKKQILAGKV